jgi:hypothetical protein
MTLDWPTAELDPVRRLRVLAAGVRGAHVTEQLIPAPLPVVWAALTDFEGDFTRVVTDMHRVTIENRDLRSVTLLAQSRFGFRARLSGPVHDGWCLLQSRFLLVAIAAVAEDPANTRVAFTGGVRVPRQPAIIPIRVKAEGRRSLNRLAGMFA